MYSRLDPAVVEALQLRQTLTSETGDTKDPRTRKAQRRAVRQMRVIWGGDAARSLERLYEAQSELGRLFIANSPEVFTQRDIVMERRRALDREIEMRRAKIGANGVTGTGRYIRDRIYKR